jgi:NTE family protein
VARAVALSRAPRPTRRLSALAGHLDSLGAEFDGRLRIAAVDRGSGRRVLFGAPGAPTAAVRDAVLASCAVPWLFAAVEIDGREYVDGGVWSPINLDAAPGGRGAHVLCLAPTAGAGPFKTLTAAALVAEEMALRARGMRLQTVAPDDASAAAMGPNLMDRHRVEDVIDAGFAQGVALTREP